MLELQKITDAWGDWKAKQYKTKRRYTESTNYKKQSSLDQYRQYECTVAVQDIQYDSNRPPTPGADVAYSLWYDNATSLEQTQLFRYTAESRQTFAWSITESLAVGVEVSATASIPEVASATTKVSVDLSLSSTQGASWEETKAWEVKNPVHIAPKTSLKVDLLINTQSYDIPFTQSALLAGHVAIWFEDKVVLHDKPHWLYFIPIQTVFSDCRNYNIVSVDGYRITGNGVLATARGKLSGKQGISVGVTATEYPLRTATASNEFRSLKQVELYPGAVAAE